MSTADNDGTTEELVPRGKLSCGYQFSCSSSMDAALDEARAAKLDFVVLPLVHPRQKRDAGGVSDARELPLTRSDMQLNSWQWNDLVVGRVSKWIDLDSPSAAVRKVGTKVLRQETAWATHLSLPAVLLPSPRQECFNYAAVVSQVVLQARHLHAWIEMPLGGDDVGVETTATTGERPSSGPGSGTGHDPWRTWNTFRTLCDSSPNLHVALVAGKVLPKQSALDRWIGEPVRALVLPTNVFVLNRKGYPTLPDAHKRLVLALFKHKVQFVLSGRPRGTTASAALGTEQPQGHEKASLLPYQMYLSFLVSRGSAGMTQMEQYEAPYLDQLQAPLQPLMDNLESQTYETFEKDPIKYAQYQEAIRRALVDMPADKKVVLMVVGAGRGPLVKCALRAASAAQRELQVYAVEKNPNAVVTLRNMKASLPGWKAVTLVHMDMREWQPPQLADILVSELLGSWGDNELSPECLDGAQRLLKPDTGISIPYEYTSFVSPVMTPRLWNEARSFSDELKSFETPYVVKLHNFSELAPAQPCFTFVHPNKKLAEEEEDRQKKQTGTAEEEGSSSSDTYAMNSPKDIDNSRFKTLSFTAGEDATMHGFAGYFEAYLYKDVMISINPKTFSTGMFSWFPVYIPLRHPMTVKRGDNIQVQFWRHVASSKVWYEWSVTSPMCSPVHNPNGRSYFVGLYTS